MSHVVSVAAIGLLCPAGVGEEGATGGRPGEVPGFRARAYVVNRKNLKLMSRAVKLGVSGIRLALAQVEDWEQVPPERRGMFVGSTPLGGEVGDLSPALHVSSDDKGKVDLQAFATQGYPLIHPLWLVKGLSNNVLGFASAAHNFQGVNGNYCDGAASGANALEDCWNLHHVVTAIVAFDPSCMNIARWLKRYERRRCWYCDYWRRNRRLDYSVRKSFGQIKVLCN